MLPVADGLALAARLKGTKQVAAAFCGEGATSEGDFHEAVNLAAVWKLPVMFVVENNQYALSTPTAEQFACRNLADKAAGYGMQGAVVDGNNVIAVYHAVADAAERARRGEGPTLLEFKTFRMRGHEEASGTDYVPDQLIAEWGQKDPVVRLERLLLEQGVMLAERAPRGARRHQGEGRRAGRRGAGGAGSRESTAAAELADVYAAAPPSRGSDPPHRPRRARTCASWTPSGRTREAMERDQKTVLIGQDIADYGGVFKVTEGFLEKYGKARVRNTPIIESGALGCALGLALDGFKPMVEMQFGDFISCGFNQIVNNLAKTRYRWAADVPVVIRAPIGGGVGRRPVPFAERRVVVHERRRAQGGGAVDTLRRQGPAARRVRRRQPGAVPRTQVPVPPGEGPGAGRLLHRADRPRRAWCGWAPTRPSSPTASGVLWADAAVSASTRRTARSSSSTCARCCRGTSRWWSRR